MRLLPWVLNAVGRVRVAQRQVDADAAGPGQCISDQLGCAFDHGPGRRRRRAPPPHTCRCARRRTSRSCRRRGRRATRWTACRFGMHRPVRVGRRPVLRHRKWSSKPFCAGRQVGLAAPPDKVAVLLERLEQHRLVWTHHVANMVRWPRTSRCTSRSWTEQRLAACETRLFMARGVAERTRRPSAPIRSRAAGVHRRRRSPCGRARQPRHWSGLKDHDVRTFGHEIIPKKSWQEWSFRKFINLTFVQPSLTSLQPSQISFTLWRTMSVR